MDDIESARKNAIQVLCVAQARDLITVDGFESRLALVKSASNSAMVGAVIADLQTGEVTAVPAELTDRGPAALAPAPEYIKISAVLGSSTRKGPWIVPFQMSALVVLGELKLDFRDALCASDYLDLDLNVIFGQIDLVVPPGTQIQYECDEFMSSLTHKRKRAPTEPGQFLIRIRGRTRCAQVTIKEQHPDGVELNRFQQRVAHWWEKTLGG